MALAGSIYANMILNIKGWNKSVSKILTKDLPKLGTGIKRLSSSLNQMGNSMTMAGAAISAGLGLGVKSFIKAADTADSFKMRLSTLLRSVEEGNKTFRSMAVLAGHVPQQYEEIMRSATALAGVMDTGREGIEKWMIVLADLESAYDLGMDVVTANFIRAYSAGISASDKFREAGISNMMGFQANVRYGAEETRRIMYESWAKIDSKFRGTTAKLAKIWSGVISMLKDKWFLFRVAVMGDTGIWKTMKENLSAFDAAINRNREAITAWIEANAIFLQKIALSIGGVLALGIAMTALGIAMKLAAFAVGGLGIIVSAVALLFNPWILAIGGVVVAIYSLRAAWNDNLGGIRDIIEFFVAVVVSGISDFAKSIYKSFTEGMFSPITYAAKTFANFMISTFKILAITIGNIFSGAISDTVATFADMIDIMKTLRKEGGATAADLFKIGNTLYDISKRDYKINLDMSDIVPENWLDIYQENPIEKLFSTESFDKAKLGAKVVFGAFKDVAAKTMDSVVKQFDKDMASLVAVIEEHFPGATDKFNELLGGMDKFKNDFIDILNELRNQTEELGLKKTIEDITSVWDQLRNSFETGLKGLRETFVDFSVFMTGEITDLANTIQDSLSNAFQNVIKKQESTKEAFKNFMKAVGDQIIKSAADTVAREIKLMIFAEKTKEAIAKTGAEQSILLRLWQSQKEQFIAEQGFAFKTAMALKEVALNMWTAAKNVAIAIWNATAKIWNKFSGVWGGPVLAMIETASMTAAIGAVSAAGIGAGGMQAMLNGTDFVDQTGPYWLHRGEKVKSRAESDGEGETQPIVINNILTPASIAAAMAGKEGENVINNVFVAGMSRNAEVRRSVRKYS